MIRSLFCLSNAALYGSNKVLFEIVARLRAAGQQADIFVLDRFDSPDWFSSRVPIVEAGSIAEALGAANYDFVYFSDSHLIPLAWPYLGQARPVFICQGYESFIFADSYAAMKTELDSFAAIVKMPVSIISVSKSVRDLLRERLGKNSYYVPIGIDDIFFETPKTIVHGANVGGERISWRRGEQPVKGQPKRILMVGDYLVPLKGMRVACDAIEELSASIPVQLVLITQQHRGRGFFDKYQFPIELHLRPEQKRIAEIYRSCDLFCCASWYEGFGLPAVESFASGIPVVSTKTDGVSDYGLHEENLLLAEPNNVSDLYEQMKSLLSDKSLCERLVKNGLAAAKRYRWDASLSTFMQVQKRLLEEPQCNPASVPESEIQKIITLLSKDDIYVSQELHMIFRKSAAELEDICGRISRGAVTIKEGVEELKKLESRLLLPAEEDKKNGRRKRSCLALYDFCRLLISLEDDEHFFESLKTV